jgi:NADH-quinone oxidoreductase subunit N
VSESVSLPVVLKLVGVFGLVLPETLLVLAACVFFVGGTFYTSRKLWAVLALLMLGGAGWLLLIPGWPGSVAPNVQQPLTLDALAFVIKVLAILGGIVLVLLGIDEVPEQRAAEYYGCLLITVAGLCLTSGANDLVYLFLGLEFISIPTYVILYLQRTDQAAQESAAKYFLLSIFAAAILLFGFSYLYGITGTTNISGILAALKTAAPRIPAEPSRLPILFIVALVMVTAGLGFKITAVPFHFYAPDVYQGTTISSAALLAFVPKAAGFVALVRVLGFVWASDRPGLALGWQGPILFWILAAMTMTIGNILALLQDNLKRILAYSSVAHAGYMLIGLAAAPGIGKGGLIGGVEAVLFYLVAYSAMTIGAFAGLAYLNSPEHPINEVDDLAGISQSQPGVAAMMALFMFSLIGIPLTAGFTGKLFLFFGALSVRPDVATDDHVRLFRWLAVIGAINAAIGAWFYLRIVAAMYLRTPLRPIEKPRAWPGLAALWICAVVTVAMAVPPPWLLQALRDAVGQ